MLTKIPLLENGDRLNRYEFEKRAENISQSRKVELIDGVVYMAAALRYKGHGFPRQGKLAKLIYRFTNKLGLVESIGGIILRTSHLDLDVRLSPHPAPEYVELFARAVVNVIVATFVNCC